jgi:flagellar basal body rod protein FlgC
MRISSIAASGMRAGRARLDAGASAIAQSGGVDPISAAAGVQSGLPEGGTAVRLTSFGTADATEALVDALEGALTYRANATMMHVGDGLIGALLDLKA